MQKNESLTKSLHGNRFIWFVVLGMNGIDLSYELVIRFE